MSDSQGAIRLDATVTCPNCGAVAHTTMPEDTCQFFWDCPDCGIILRPREDDCCVFCSYADVPCPPVQRGRACC